MSVKEPGSCCPPFDPVPWNDRTLEFAGRRFVRDRVTSFLHIPLNFRSVMQRNMARIEAAGAAVEPGLVLSDERSPWRADVYIEVAKDVPGAQMASIPGTFLARVFEGPYRDVRRWVEDMKAVVAARGRQLRRLLFYYTTCPACAKRHGKNYVVLFAEI